MILHSAQCNLGRPALVGPLTCLYRPADRHEYCMVFNGVAMSKKVAKESQPILGVKMRRTYHSERVICQSS